jgi:hypothetical protein
MWATGDAAAKAVPRPQAQIAWAAVRTRASRSRPGALRATFCDVPRIYPHVADPRRHLIAQFPPRRAVVDLHRHPLRNA